MTRRAFLLFASVLSLTPWTTRFATAWMPAHEGELLDLIARVLSDFDGTEMIGRRFLDAYPAEASRISLIRNLFPADLNSRGTMNINTLRRYLAMQRERDFKEGEIVRVDGWILARTEARICALVALV